MDNTLLILILGIQAALLTALAIIFLVAARKVFTFIREVKVWVDAHGDINTPETSPQPVSTVSTPGTYRSARRARYG